MHKYMYSRICRAPEFEGSSGGGQGNNDQGGQQGGGQQGQQGQQAAPQKQGLDRFAEIWTPPKPAGRNDTQSGGGGNPKGGGGNDTQSGGGSSSDTYFTKQNYFEGVNTQPMQEAFENQDFGKFQSALGDFMRNFHRKVLGESVKIAQNFATEAEKNAMNKFGQSYSIDKTYEAIFSKHPELKLPAVMPKAKEIIANAIRGGKGVDEAGQLAYDYFKEVGAHFNKPPANPSGRGVPPSGGSETSGDDIKWDEFFGSPGA